VRAAVRVMPEVEHLDDAGIRDRGRRTCLVEEAVDDLAVRRQLREQDLDRSAAPDQRVLRFIDGAHTAFADFTDDTVLSDRGSLDHCRKIITPGGCNSRPFAEAM